MKAVLVSLFVVGATMFPNTIYANDVPRHPVLKEQKPVFNTPREWRKHYWSYTPNLKSVTSTGMIFTRTNDDIDLTKYSQDQIAYESWSYVTPNTRVVLLPYGTFIWKKTIDRSAKRPPIPQQR